MLNSLLSVGVFGLDFFFRSKRYRALSLVFLSGGEVVKAQKTLFIRKLKKKLTLLNSLLSVGVFGLDFFSGQNGIGH